MVTKATTFHFSVGGNRVLNLDEVTYGSKHRNKQLKARRFGAIHVTWRFRLAWGISTGSRRLDLTNGHGGIAISTP